MNAKYLIAPVFALASSAAMAAGPVDDYLRAHSFPTSEDAAELQAAETERESMDDRQQSLAEDSRDAESGTGVEEHAGLGEDAWVPLSDPAEEHPLG